MKTVDFKYRGEGLYIVDGEQNWGDSYGTYVLASEANERIKVLEGAAACGLSALKIASRQLTEDMKLVLNGKRWGGMDIDRLEKALGIKSAVLEVK